MKWFIILLFVAPVCGRDLRNHRGGPASSDDEVSFSSLGTESETSLLVNDSDAQMIVVDASVSVPDGDIEDASPGTCSVISSSDCFYSSSSTGCFEGSHSEYLAEGEMYYVDFRGAEHEGVIGWPAVWPRTGNIYVSFQFMLAEGTNQNVYFLLVSGNERLGNTVPFQRSGNIGFTSLVTETYVWYLVEYEINMGELMYSIRVNGLPVDFGPVGLEEVPCGYGLPYPDYIGFHGGYSDQHWSGYIRELSVITSP